MGSSITAFDNDEQGVCADSPSAAAIATDLQQPTQDLGVLEAPGTESVNQGNVARVKFQLDYAGDGNPAPTFLLDASTNIPGATAVPSAPLLTPEDGSNPVRVIVRPPVSTPTGTYDVTLLASLPGGETRSSTHEVLVTPTTVRCTETAPTIAGTRGDDVLIGTQGPDVIAGYAGKGSTGPTVSLRASTNVPGASVKPVPSTLTPSGGTSRARAVLQLPPDTPTGSYDVTLIATTPNGQVRSRTRELKVGQKRGAGCGRATATITGTRRADRLVGTRHRDVIAGFGGNDRIFGRGGNDLICAGAGNDFVRGGPGNDTIAGRAGRDMLIGGTGSDVLIGGRGKDRFRH